MYWWWYRDGYNGWAYGGSRQDHNGALASRPEAAPRIGAERRLALRVAEALLNDPAVTGGSIEVSVQNGVVILEGAVGTEAARCAAAGRVWSVRDVTDVCNALTIADEGTGRTDPA
ncbi:BON domain-containing protein [Actinoplanes sp. NPDC024001]|uniref:BON domain-containing protein n=1 Tax=Actinoplanes sp. NPDC024001 TaxID=3154598 RepID=UPI0033EA85D3